MPPASGIHSLPEELLSWIFAIHFARIPEVFCRTLSRPRKSPLPINPPSVALLVSQKWRRVGTPLLYRFLSISTKAHAQQVAAVIGHYGCYVRHVRLGCDGGYGEIFKTILSSIPHIESLSIDLPLKSRDSIVGLRDTLSGLNPSALYIYLPPQTNVKSRHVLSWLAAAVQNQWTILKRIHFIFWCPEDEGLIAAMISSTTLEEIFIHDMYSLCTWGLKQLLRRIYAGSKNKRVVYHSPDDPWAVKRFMLLRDVPSDVKKLLQRAEDYPEED